MNKRLVVVIAIILLLLALPAAYFLLTSANTSESDTTETQESQVNPDTQNTEEDRQEAESFDPAEPIVDIEGGRYVNYDKDLIPFAENGTVVLSFHAIWCPSCNTLDRNLKESHKAGEIPDDLLIMKVDYDSSNSLRQKYGVTLQHTLVQVDENGDKLKLWNGLYDQYKLEDILKRII